MPIVGDFRNSILSCGFPWNDKTGPAIATLRKLITCPWEPVNWQRFYTQSVQLGKIEATSGEFIKLFTDARTGNLSPAGFSNPGIRRALETFGRVAKGALE